MDTDQHLDDKQTELFKRRTPDQVGRAAPSCEFFGVP